jgi:hypothetical protein
VSAATPPTPCPSGRAPTSIAGFSREPLRRAFATRWDEVNLWKLYTYFGPIRAVRRPQTGHAGWLRERLPWVTHARVLGAVGGNTCRHIRADCEAGRRTLDHPFDGRCWEGAEQRAAQYEILRDEGPEDVLDASTWRRHGRPARAGSPAPERVGGAVRAGRRHDYRTYHWNQRPVRDHDHWRRYVARAAQIASAPNWPEWRF